MEIKLTDIQECLVKELAGGEELLSKAVTIGLLFYCTSLEKQKILMELLNPNNEK